MKKIISIIAILLTITTMSFVLAPAFMVKASGGVECTTPGAYGVVGPYGNRICDTGIIFTGMDSSAEIVAFSSVPLLGGLFLIVNGKLLRLKAK